jgi:phage gpG-like protein
MITVEIKSEAVVARLKSMPDKVRAALVRKITQLALMLEGKVKSDKLSGQVLNVVSGNLRASIHSKVEQTATSVTGYVFSDGSVKYAAIHEFGGTQNRVSTKGKAYQIVFPERSFLRSSLREEAENIVRGIKEAVSEGIKE